MNQDTHVDLVNSMPVNLDSLVLTMTLGKTLKVFVPQCPYLQSKRKKSSRCLGWV